MQIKNAPSARTRTHTFHSARSFDNDGVPAFNPDRYAVPSSIAFIEGEGGEGGAGGGDGNAGGGAPKTLTQEQVNGLLAKERKAWEAKLASATGEATSKLQAELDALKAAHEDAGKSAAEKAQAAAARERAVIEAKLNDTTRALAEREAVIATRTQELRDTRLDHELNGHLAVRKVLPQAQRAAMLVFKADAKFEYDDAGTLTAVDVGNKRFDSLALAIDDWMISNGSIYVAATQGGAGSRAGTAGGSTVPLIKRSTEELIADADRLRKAAR